MRMEEKRIPKRVLEWKPIGRRNKGRPRKKMDRGHRRRNTDNGNEGGESCVRNGRNGRKSLRRLKSTVGCNTSKRRRRES